LSIIGIVELKRFDLVRLASAQKSVHTANTVEEQHHKFDPGKHRQLIAEWWPFVAQA